MRKRILPKFITGGPLAALLLTLNALTAACSSEIIESPDDEAGDAGTTGTSDTTGDPSTDTGGTDTTSTEDTGGTDTTSTQGTGDTDTTSTEDTGGSFCGDGNVDQGEACDDGNTDSNDGCSAMCLLEACGDGVVQLNEECDDGNIDDGDACSADCQLEVCQGVADLEESPECEQCIGDLGEPMQECCDQAAACNTQGCLCIYACLIGGGSGCALGCDNNPNIEVLPGDEQAAQALDTCTGSLACLCLCQPDDSACP